jgi:23S rRNA (cytidine1920-2'-O)/16S rRNA (cytidine1409-2'-O)-methyltransferase
MQRLDSYLFKNHYTQSRNRAKELIKNGLVLVDGVIQKKASLLVENPTIEIILKKQYVSRAGEKLKSFLEDHRLLLKDKLCLDIGSSTGGFIEVLLEKGAKRVDGVDVGRGQLHPTLKDDKRVRSFEECDIREFRSDTLYDLITCDVSFVGISYVIQEIDRFAKSDIIILFKPQFEVGREVKRDKKGVVKDSEAIILAQKRFEGLAKELNWKLIKKSSSKLKGKEGNEEIFYHFKRG